MDDFLFFCRFAALFNNLVKFSQHAKVLGGGLVVVDFSSRVGSIHNSYKAGGQWERELFVESLSFSAGAYMGLKTVGAGLSLLVFATPFGWAGLIIGGVAIAGVAAGVSILTNNAAKERGGAWYDYAMKVISE